MTCDRVLQKGKVRWGSKFSLLNSWRVICCLKYTWKVEKWIFQKNVCVDYLCARITSLTTLTLTYSGNFWPRTLVMTKVLVFKSYERNVRFWSSEQRLIRFQDRKRIIFQSTAFASVAPGYKDKFFVKFPVCWLIIFY